MRFATPWWLIADCCETMCRHSRGLFTGAGSNASDPPSCSCPTRAVAYLQGDDIIWPCCATASRRAHQCQCAEVEVERVVAAMRARMVCADMWPTTPTNARHLHSPNQFDRFVRDAYVAFNSGPPSDVEPSGEERVSWRASERLRIGRQDVEFRRFR